MESPKDELIELQYRQIQYLYNKYVSMNSKLEQLEKQLNYEKRKN
jgi:hypothetical protein